MTREEALRELMDIRDEATAYPDAVCYVTSEDEDALNVAIEALSAESPKGDLISRWWLLELYGDYIGDDGESKYYVPLEVVRQNIKDAPSAEARQTGEWVRCKKQNKADLDNGNALYECSNCGHTDLHAETQEVPYCWYCGARMKGGDDE